MTSFCINARFLTQHTTGVQRFATEVVKELIKIHPDLVLVAPSDVKHRELAKDWNVQIIGRRKGHLWEQTDLPGYLKSRGTPLLVNLCNTAPLYYSNQIVTIHDLAFLVNPKWFSISFSLAYRFLIPRIARRARTVVTVSHAAKADLVKLLKIESAKVKVVYNAVPSSLLTASQQLAHTNEKPYLLAVGSIDPRKNLVNLVHAFKQLALPSVNLLIVGSENKVFGDKNLRSMLEKEPSITFTGYVSDEQLVNLYQGAALFIYPSLYEGFGIPPLEAMHHGCAVVISDIPSLREICGTAARYVNPRDSSSIADGIEAVLANPDLKKKLVLSGQEQVKKYNWATSAKILSELIRVHDLA